MAEIDWTDIGQKRSHDMKLFGSYTSPYVRHCRIVLAQNGQDCEFVETDYE